MAQHWIGRMGAVPAALLVALLVTSCFPSTSAGPGGTTANASRGATTVGTYVGNGGGGSLHISFTASATGIDGLAGTARLVCTQTTGNSTQYSVASSIPLVSNSFTSDTTMTLPSGGTAELKVSGTLDGSGHASGTLSDNLAGACNTGETPITWNAAIGGSASATNQPTSSCSPQPCGSSGGLTVYVTGLIHVSTQTFPPCDSAQQICPDRSPTPDLVEATFTVTNNDSAAHDTGAPLALYKLQPGSDASVVDNDVSSLGVLRDGTPCRGDDASLEPGAHSPTLHTCFLMTDAQLTKPFKFIWSIDTGNAPAGGTIDLSGVSMQ